VMSSRRWVGRDVKSCASQRKSSRKSWVAVCSRKRLWFLVCCNAACRVLKSPRLPGRAMVMLRSSPSSWCQRCREMRVRERGMAARISWRRVARCGGSAMVCATVSSSHPRTTFFVAQWPSPVASFFCEIGSCRDRWSVGAKGRKTWSIHWNNLRRTCWSCSVLPWASAMWSSTKTSAHASGCVDWVDAVVVAGRFWLGPDVASAAASRRCGGAVWCSVNAALARSVIVSVAAQNRGGSLSSPLGGRGGRRPVWAVALLLGIPLPVPVCDGVRDGCGRIHRLSLS